VLHENAVSRNPYLLSIMSSSVASNNNYDGNADGSKSNSVGIQTRYSFYEAANYNEKNDIAGSGSAEERPQISLKSAELDSCSVKLDSCMSGCTDSTTGSSGAGDILRNLVAAEGLSKTGTAYVGSTDRNISQSSVMATVRGMSRRISDLSLLDNNTVKSTGDGNSLTSPDDGLENSVCTGDRPGHGSSQGTKTDKIVGDESDMALLSEPAIPPEVKNNAVEDNSPLVNVMEEALHFIRARGQNRAALLNMGTSNTEDRGVISNSETESKNLMAVNPAILSTGESNFDKALPLSPHSSKEPGQNLMPATKLEDRLLSPAVDVRKTVAGSASEMFRLGGNPENKSTASISSLSTPYKGLTLANPVYSQTTPRRENGNVSPVHTSSKPALRVSTVPPLFTVVPSSPAPGKMHTANEKDKETSTPLINESTISNGNLLESDARRVALELREEEIERCVEKVLLTILDRANNKPSAESGTKGCDTESSWIDQTFSSFFAEHSPVYMIPMQDKENVDVVTGVEEFINPTPSEENQAVNHEDDTFTSSQNAVCGNEETTHSSIDECANSNSSSAKARTDPQQPSSLMPLPHLTETEPTRKSPTSPPLDTEPSERLQTYTNHDGVVEVEAIDKEKYPSLSTDENEVQMNNYDKVLGPLSKEVGGTTGVVLQCDGEHDDTHSIQNIPKSFSDDKELNDPHTEPSASLSPSIIESITSAVRRGSSDIIADCGDQSNDSILDSERQELEEIFEGDDNVLKNKSLNIPAKALYAHLLPGDSGRVKGTLGNWLSEKLGAKIEDAGQLQPWNDEDPNEPGYVSYSLTSAQLKNVEEEYENILSNMAEENHALSEVELDIAAAELILKETEMKKKDLSQQKLARRNKKDLKAHSPIRRRRSKGANPLSTNPLFPVAKAAGTGAEGELELYHLPIIYKAHQTGFEPTKDLVLQPDTVFAGKYYVQNELGSAAFSTAYRCVDLNSGKEGDDNEMYYDEVCLKVIKNTKDFFDQSLDEIKILELLRQTDRCNEMNILEMKAFFYHKEHLIIVTELLRQNLFEFGKYIMENDEPRYFSRPRLCYIARQCLVALNFVHKLGLVHSDIKPENILLASYSKAKVKVIDFGSSCYLSDRQSSYIQSRSYRAPEVILGLPYDGKIDVWSLGCVIAEMYTGQVTFQNDSVTSMLSRIEAICGTFPSHMIENGRQSAQFFTPNGLLYEKDFIDDESENRITQSGVDEEEDRQDVNFTVYQPKVTTMAARLGFEPNLMNRNRRKWEGEDIEHDDRPLFVDFVHKLLTIDPDRRLSAAEAMEHPWILSGYNVPEEDLKYPPEE